LIAETYNAFRRKAIRYAPYVPANVTGNLILLGSLMSKAVATMVDVMSIGMMDEQQTHVVRRMYYTPLDQSLH